MGFAQEAGAQGQALCAGDLLSGEGQCVDVVADIPNVVWTFGLSGSLERHDVLKGCLRALDFRRDDRLLADKSVQEPLGAGHHRAGDAELADGRQGLGVQCGQPAIERQRRIGWGQRRRHERPDFFPPSPGNPVGSCRAWHN